VSGFYIGAHFVGALVYADDIVVVAPSATALRKMLAIAKTMQMNFAYVSTQQNLNV